MFNDDRVTGAHLERISVHALPKKNVDTLLLAELNVRIHSDAITGPEVVQVLLADPFRGSLCVIQVLSLKLNALVMLDIGLELIVADHGVPEQSDLVAGLRLLKVHQLVCEIVLNGLMHHFDLFLVVTRHGLMRINMMMSVVLLVMMFLFKMMVMIVIISARIIRGITMCIMMIIGRL